MAQHILLTVVLLVMDRRWGSTQPVGSPVWRWKPGQAGVLALAPGRHRAPMMARLRSWIWKHREAGPEGKQRGKGPSVPCDSSIRLLKSKWMDAKPW